MIKRLYNYLKAYFETPPKPKDPIDKVFTIGKKVFYQFKDISKIKCERALVSNDAYNELSMGATRDFLTKHTEAVDKLLNSNKIDIFQIKTLNTQLQERLQLIYETDLIYKIASIVFFTKDEDPYQYDDLLGREKIDLFKSQGDGFFFDKLFKSLIGSVDISDKDLQTYMMVGDQMTKEHLRVISTILSNKSVTNA